MNSLIPAAADPVGMLVFFLLVFAVVGIFFLFVHLLMGKFIRPSVPDAEKLTIYECGEPTVGSAWIQFDLRFYVVALLFVIFDVEVAFFFPWAVVFGKTNQLANLDPPAKVVYLEGEKKGPLTPEQLETEAKRLRGANDLAKLDPPPRFYSLEGDKKKPLTPEQLETQAKRLRLSMELLPTVSLDGRGIIRRDPTTKETEVVPIDPESASGWAQIAFFDLLVFFGVLMVGFAYVWRRGDIDWVRAYAPHHEPAMPPQKPLEETKSVA